MPIWDGATALLLERSSDGNTASVLGAGDAVVASCDDAGTVVGSDGSTLMTVGELYAADRRGRELAVTCGDSTVASLALVDRDRGIRRTVERWSLSVEARPPASADLLAAATILRYGKLLAAVSAPGPG